MRLAQKHLVLTLYVLVTRLRIKRKVLSLLLEMELLDHLDWGMRIVAFKSHYVVHD